ncbi:MAG: hypothetical protein RI932_1753, partial [Pseudomonadota bacterium]
YFAFLEAEVGVSRTVFEGLALGDSAFSSQTAVHDAWNRTFTQSFHPIAFWNPLDDFVDALLGRSLRSQRFEISVHFDQMDVGLAVGDRGDTGHEHRKHSHRSQNPPRFVPAGLGRWSGVGWSSGHDAAPSKTGFAAQ